MIRNAITATNLRAAFALSSRRTLHSSPAASKTAKEKVVEVADKVNKSVGRGLASAIETGEHVTEVTKETFGAASHKAKDTASTAKQGANQAAAGARQTKDEVKSSVQKELHK